MLNVAAPVFQPSGMKPGYHRLPNTHAPLHPNLSSRALNTMRSSEPLDPKGSQALRAQPTAFYPPQRYGHRANMQSVQLTGLPTFLGSSFRATDRYQERLSGSASSRSRSLSPIVSVDGSNGYAPQRPPAKGALGVTPLKIKGHNSTPSVSMAPTFLSAAAAKKTVTVCMPNEGPLPEDLDWLDEELNDPIADEAQNTPEHFMKDLIKISERSSAHSSAITRLRWIKRKPGTEFEPNQGKELPETAMMTRPVYPDSWQLVSGLPDTIDIYLPGMCAWEDVCQQESGVSESESEAEASEPPPVVSVALNPFAAPFQSHRKSRSISTPPLSTPLSASAFDRDVQAPHNSLASQSSSQADLVPRTTDSIYRLELPARLREAFEQSQSKGAKLKTGFGHGYSMSLNLPSSGGPFAPDVFSALDLIRSDADDSVPESSARTDAQAMMQSQICQDRPALFLSDILESSAEDEVEDLNADEAQPPQWRTLAEGFGYFADESVHEAVTASDNAFPRFTDANEVATTDFDQGRDEVCTNPSEDGNTSASEFDEDFDHVTLHNWQFQRKRSPIGQTSVREYDDNSASEDSEEDVAGASLSENDEEYSNPSDEEAARERRILRRQRHLLLRANGTHGAGGRARANTNNTLPSSSLGEGDMYEYARRPFGAVRLRHGEGSTNSNPSDDLASDLDPDTISTRQNHARRSDTARLSQDFRFPPLPQSAGSRSSKLNAGAKEFTLGHPRSASGNQEALTLANDVEGAAKPYHFRLPSITISNFGSAESDVAITSASRLNVAAPAFVPAAFTFTSPDGIRLSVPDSAKSLSSVEDDFSEADMVMLSQDQREAQGREKRQRQGPVGHSLYHVGTVAPDTFRQGKGADYVPRAEWLSSEEDAQSPGMQEEHQERQSNLNDDDRTSTVEELASRVDQALEGWAGRILDEVTIMGQVRPRQSSSPKPDLDVRAVVEEVSRRVEDLIDSRLSRVYSSHSRRSSTDTSDDTQSTIRAARRRLASPTARVGLVRPFDPLDPDDLLAALDTRIQDQQSRIERILAEDIAVMSQKQLEAEIRATKVEAAYSQLGAFYKAEEDKVAILHSRNEELLLELQSLKLQQTAEAERFARSLAENVARAVRAEESAIAAQTRAQQEAQQRSASEGEANARLQSAAEELRKSEAQRQVLENRIAEQDNMISRYLATAKETPSLSERHDAYLDETSSSFAYPEGLKIDNVSNMGAVSRQDISLDEDGWWR